jgi:hypothetical protein
MIQLFPLGINDRGIGTLGGKLFLIVAVVAVVHLLMSFLFGLDEARAVMRRLRRLIIQPLKISF